MSDRSGDLPLAAEDGFGGWCDVARNPGSASSGLSTLGSSDTSSAPSLSEFGDGEWLQVQSKPPSRQEEQTPTEETTPTTKASVELPSKCLEQEEAASAYKVPELHHKWLSAGSDFPESIWTQVQEESPDDSNTWRHGTKDGTMPQGAALRFQIRHGPPWNRNGGQVGV